jgi:predicted RNA-binding Zn-ribbon protein involved in translation (DUF1610 family)
MVTNRDKMIYCVSCLTEHEHMLIDNEWICPACGNPACSRVVELLEEREKLASENKMFAKKLSALGYRKEQISSIAYGIL